ncbi:hypothetical protein C8R45DRAFT_1029064 [Mycena sanguinolenta]|nr:hypothetical protein C8R45DRAFT_1029064 [Mycena sanguinolenta]
MARARFERACPVKPPEFETLITDVDHPPPSLSPTHSSLLISTSSCFRATPKKVRKRSQCRRSVRQTRGAVHRKRGGDERGHAREEKRVMARNVVIADMERSCQGQGRDVHAIVWLQWAVVLGPRKLTPPKKKNTSLLFPFSLCSCNRARRRTDSPPGRVRELIQRASPSRGRRATRSTKIARHGRTAKLSRHPLIMPVLSCPRHVSSSGDAPGARRARRGKRVRLLFCATQSCTKNPMPRRSPAERRRGRRGTKRERVDVEMDTQR